MEAWPRPQARALAWLRSRGPVYHSGRPWTQRFRTGLNGGTRAPANDEPVRRGHLAPIDCRPAPLRDGEPPMEPTAARPRFRDRVQILPGFRGRGWFTARPVLGERGDFRRLARMAYRGRGPSPWPSGPPLRYGSITQTGHVHARKALVRAAWKYTWYPRVSVARPPRQRPGSARTIAVRPRAPKRWYPRDQALKRRKAPQVAIPALARELAGFWCEAMPPEAAESPPRPDPGAGSPQHGWSAPVSTFRYPYREVRVRR